MVFATQVAIFTSVSMIKEIAREAVMKTIVLRIGLGMIIAMKTAIPQHAAGMGEIAAVGAVIVALVAMTPCFKTEFATRNVWLKPANLTPHPHKQTSP